MERRTLIRLLVGLGIGIPVAIELATFLRLFERGLFEDERPAGSTATPGADRVGIGDELLPGTAPSDVVTRAEVRTGERRWTFLLGVAVTNATDRPYELRLGTVTTAAGTRVDGGGTTGRLQPGEEGAVLGRWSLVEGATPDRVAVTAISFPSGTAPAEVVDRTVPLATVPVRGR